MKVLSNNTRLLAISLSLIVSMILSSCIKDRIDMNKISYAVDWNPKYGMPVAYGNLTLKDIIESIDKDAIIKEDSITKLLYLSYSNKLFSKTAKDLINIPSQTYKEIITGITIPIFPPLTPDTVYYQQTSNYSFNFANGEEIDSVHFKAGKILFHVSSGFKHTGRVWITMTSLKLGGKPLKIPININLTNGNFIADTSYELKDYKLGLTSVNQIPFKYEVALDRNSGQAISSSEKIIIDIQIQNATFSSLYGYIGNYAILPTTTSKLNIGIFDNYNSLSVDFSDPRIRLYIANSFGAPIEVQLSNVYTWSQKNQHNFNINFITGNPFTIKAPSLSLIGDTATTVIQFDKNNSNLFSAVPDIPQYLEYTVSATSNPGVKAKNFVLDTSRLDVDFDFDLPFNVKASNIQHEDTINFDLGSAVSDFSIVKKLALFNTFKNSIPFDLKLQVILTDSSFAHIDSLYSATNQPIIKSGILDVATNRYKVDPGAPIIPPVIFDQARAKKFDKVKHAIIRISMTTVGNGQYYAAFYSNYYLNIAFQVQTELEVKSLNQF